MVTGGGCGKSLSPLFLFSEKALPLLISFSGKITFCFHRKSSCPSFSMVDKVGIFCFSTEKVVFSCVFQWRCPFLFLISTKKTLPLLFSRRNCLFPLVFFFRKSPSPLVLPRARRATPLSIILNGP